MIGFLAVTGAPTGWGLPLSDGTQLRHGVDVLGAIADAQAAGYTVVAYGPEALVVSEIRDGLTSGLDLRLWDHTTSHPPARAELVDFTSPSQMAAALVPSVTIDLQCRITRIDWLAPGATPADPFGERFAGTLVIREDRTWTEGPLGPVSRVDTLTAYLQDGTPGETWTRGKRYDGRISAERGDKRRRECVQRMTTWLGVAGVATGLSPDEAVLAIVGWASTIGAEREAFERLANPGPLLGAVTVAADTWWGVPCAAIGLDVGLPAGATVRDAVLASLSTWIPA